jgi:hypothetical protein
MSLAFTTISEQVSFDKASVSFKTSHLAKISLSLPLTPPGGVLLRKAYKSHESKAIVKSGIIYAIETIAGGWVVSVM